MHDADMLIDDFAPQLKLKKEMAASVRNKSTGEWSCYAPISGAITLAERP